MSTTRVIDGDPINFVIFYLLLDLHPSMFQSFLLQGDIISNIAGKTLTKNHDLSKPQDVRGRNSDNSLLKSIIEREPSISREEGLVETYEWIQNQNKLKKTDVKEEIKV